MTMLTRSHLSSSLRAAAIAFALGGVALANIGESTAGGLTRDAVLEAARQQVVAHFGLEGELQLEPLRPVTLPARTAQTWDVSVTDFPASPSASMMLRCRLTADGENVGETTLVLRAALWRDAWVSKQPLTSGAGFDPELLEVRRVDALRERDVVPASVGDRSYIFARAVPAGRSLTWRDVARRPLVKKGDLVEVAAVDGPLVVTMKALAMQNGAAGETVTVRNPESRRDFSALVVAENRVQVRF